MLLESCTVGQKASKISWDPKLVSYNPRKRPEMAEITSFADAARVVYQGPQGIENLQGYDPRKRPEMAENTSFAHASKVVYRGAQGIEILPRPKNHGL